MVNSRKWKRSFKNIDVIVYILTAIGCTLFLIRLMTKIEIYHKVNLSNISMSFMIICIFVVLHSIRMTRFYLIISESNIHIGDFLKIYINTSIVSILVPLKLGELFKMHQVAKKTENVRFSILSVLTQIFYDVVVIISFMLISFALNGKLNTPVFFIFVIPLSLCAIAFFIYPSTFSYLNNFFIVKTHKKHDLRILKGLNELKEIYHNEKLILKGKSGLILLLSYLIWGVEFLLMASIAKLLRIPYDFKVFLEYISNIIQQNQENATHILNTYALIGIVLFVVIWVIIFVKHLLEKSRKRV